MQPLITNPITARLKENNFAKTQRVLPYKNLTLSALSILSAFSFGYFYFRYLSDDSSIWFVVGSLTLFCMFSVIRTLIGQDPWENVGIIFIETLMMTGPFFMSQSLQVFSIVSFVMFMFFVWGYAESRDEAEKSLEIRFFKIAHPYINKIVTGAVLMAAIFYLPVVSTEHSIFSRGSFDNFFSFSRGFIRAVYPNFDPQFSVGLSAQKFAENQVAGNADFAKLSESMQQSVIDQSVSSTIASLNNTLKVPVRSDETIQDLVYDFLVSTLNGWRAQFGTWFFVGWVLLVFLLVRSVGFFFSIIVSFLTFMVFNLLVATKFVRIEGEPRMKEIAKL